MTEQVEPTAVPRRVRNTGLVAAALGALGIVSGYAFAVSGVRLAHLSLASDPNVPLPFIIANSMPLGMTQLTLGILALVAGFALARGREWGRRALIVVVCLFIAFGVTYFIVVLRGGTSWDLASMTPLPLELGLLYLALRWLKSPSIRAGCR